MEPLFSVTYPMTWQCYSAYAALVYRRHRRPYRITCYVLAAVNGVCGLLLLSMKNPMGFFSLAITAAALFAARNIWKPRARNWYEHVAVPLYGAAPKTTLHFYDDHMEQITAISSLRLSYGKVAAVDEGEGFIALVAAGMGTGFIVPDDAFTAGDSQGLRRFLRDRCG